MIRTLCRRTFTVRWSKYWVPGMLKEYKDYRKALTETRKKLKEEADISHTKAEEKWLEDYTKEQETKWIRDMDKWRTSVCKIAMHTKRHMEFLQKRDAQQAERNRQSAAQYAQESFERRLMLDAMELEAKRWPNDENAEKILSESIFPPSFIDNKKYLRHIRKVSQMADLGQYEEMEEYLNNKDDLKLKNQLLRPLYRGLKGSIRELTFTEEAKAYLDYIALKERIASYYGDLNNEQKEKELHQLSKDFVLFYLGIKSKRLSPEEQVNKIYTKVNNLIHLLTTWWSYTSIVYMDSKQTQRYSDYIKERIKVPPKMTGEGTLQYEMRKLNVEGEDEEEEVVPGEEKEEAEEEDQEKSNEMMKALGIEEGEEEEEGSFKAKMMEKQEMVEEKKEEKEIKEEKEDMSMLLFDQNLIVNTDLQEGITKDEKNIHKLNDYDLTAYLAEYTKKGFKLNPLEASQFSKFGKDIKTSINEKEEEIEAAGIDESRLDVYGELEAKPKQPINIDLDALLDNEDVDDIVDDRKRLNSLDKQIRKAKGVDDRVIESMSYSEDDPHARGTLVMNSFKEILSKITDKDLSKGGKERKEIALEQIAKIEKIRIVDPRVLLKIYDTYKYKQPILQDFV